MIIFTARVIGRKNSTVLMLHLKLLNLSAVPLSTNQIKILRANIPEVKRIHKTSQKLKLWDFFQDMSDSTNTKNLHNSSDSG